MTFKQRQRHLYCQHRVSSRLIDVMYQTRLSKLQGRCTNLEFLQAGDRLTQRPECAALRNEQFQALQGGSYRHVADDLAWQVGVAAQDAIVVGGHAQALQLLATGAEDGAQLY